MVSMFDVARGFQMPNVVGGALQARQLGMESGRQRSLMELAQQHGAGLARGDAAAIDAYAAFDPEMAMSALGNQQQMELRNRADQRAAQSHEAQMSQIEYERKARQFQLIAKAAERAETPEQWNEYATWLAEHGGVPEAANFVDRFDMRDSIRNIYGDGSPEQMKTIEEMQEELTKLGVPPEQHGVAIARVLGYEIPDQTVPTFRPAAPEEAAQYGAQAGQIDTATGRFYENNPPSGMSFETTPEGGVRVVQGPGAGVSDVKLGEGQVLVRDPTSPTGVRIENVPGGASAQEAQAESEREQTARENAAQEARRNLDQVQYVRELIEKAPLYDPAVGFGTGITEQIRGSRANDYQQAVQTLEANAAFDALQAMREASPTGGALGAITERELDLLRSTLASLEAMQSREQALRALDLFEEQYSRVLEKAAVYENAEQFGFGGGAGRRPAAGGDDIEPLLRRYLEGDDG